MQSLTLLAIAFLPLVAAHFSVDYPYWRGSSFDEPASQWIWPCAGVNQTISANNRTQWPLTGGSISLEVHHQWALTYVNIELGNEVTGFEYNLVTGFNQTGNGTFCWPEVGRETLATLNLTEGQNATLQIIQIGDSGNALYNCADITFTDSAEILSGDRCTNSTGVGGVRIENAGADENATVTSSGAAATSTSGAMMHGAQVVVVAFGVLSAGFFLAI